MLQMAKNMSTDGIPKHKTYYRMLSKKCKDTGSDLQPKKYKGESPDLRQPEYKSRLRHVSGSHKFIPEVLSIADDKTLSHFWFTTKSYLKYFWDDHDFVAEVRLPIGDPQLKMTKTITIHHDQYKRHDPCPIIKKIYTSNKIIIGGTFDTKQLSTYVQMKMMNVSFSYPLGFTNMLAKYINQSNARALFDMFPSYIYSFTNHIEFQKKFHDVPIDLAVMKCCFDKCVWEIKILSRKRIFDSTILDDIVKYVGYINDILRITSARDSWFTKEHWSNDLNTFFAVTCLGTIKRDTKKESILEIYNDIYGTSYTTLKDCIGDLRDDVRWKYLLIICNVSKNKKLLKLLFDRMQKNDSMIGGVHEFDIFHTEFWEEELITLSLLHDCVNFLADSHVRKCLQKRFFGYLDNLVMTHNNNIYLNTCTEGNQKKRKLILPTISIKFRIHFGSIIDQRFDEIKQKEFTDEGTMAQGKYLSTIQVFLKVYHSRILVPFDIYVAYVKYSILHCIASEIKDSEHLSILCTYIDRNLCTKTLAEELLCHYERAHEPLASAHLKKYIREHYSS